MHRPAVLKRPRLEVQNNIASRRAPASCWRRQGSAPSWRRARPRHRSVLPTLNFFSLPELPVLPPACICAKSCCSFTDFFKNTSHSLVSNSLIWKAAGSARKDVRRVSGTRGNPVPHTRGTSCPGTGKSSKQLQRGGCTPRCRVAFACTGRILYF